MKKGLKQCHGGFYDIVKLYFENRWQIFEILTEEKTLGQNLNFVLCKKCS